MSDNRVTVTRSGNWSTVTLNRPDKLNAMTVDMLGRLRDIFIELANDPSCRAVLFTGAGRGFCTGQDLNERKGMDGPPDLGHSLDTFYNPIVRTLRAMPKPVVCAVNGVAAGAGANLALACDIVLAAKSAQFIQIFSKVGLSCDSGASHFLPRLIGDARARGLLMLGEPVTAEQAAAWGMIWKAVDDDVLGAEAAELTDRLANMPTFGLKLLKQALAASPANDLDTQLDLERDFQKRAGLSYDYAEFVKSFFEKRKPNFRGE